MASKSDERLYRQCYAAGNAIELLAVGFVKAKPGLELFHDAYPDPMPDVEFPEHPDGIETSPGSRADQEVNTPELAFFWLSVQELCLVFVENMYSTAALLKRGGGYFGFGTFSTARSALEALAVLNWLYDENIDGEGRRDRMLTELLKSASSDDSVEAALLRDIGDAGLEAQKYRRTKRYYVGEPMPTMTALLKALSISYADISAVTHGEALGRAKLLRRTSRGGKTRAEVMGTKEDLRRMLDALQRTTGEVIGKICSYSDFSVAPFLDAESRCKEVRRRNFLL